jgi:DNA-directed RNA polymerase subunit alpha
MNFQQFLVFEKIFLEILLNLKGIVFKSKTQTSQFGRLKVQGPIVITADLIQLPSRFRNCKSKSLYCNNFNIKYS